MRLHALFSQLAALALLVDPAQTHAQQAAEFDTPVTLPAGVSPTGIQSADLNRDGFLDIVVTNSGNEDGEGALSVYLSDGAGWLTARRDYRSDGPGGAQPAIVSVTGDGRLDVLTPNSTSTVSLFRGLPRGGLGGRADIAVGKVPVAIVAADFNGDGNSDFAVANYWANSTSVFLGKGNGRFAHPSSYTGHNGPGALAIVDLNMDGTLDLLVGNLNTDYVTYASTVSIRLGIGDGTFGNATEVAVGRYSGVLLTADFNGDGMPDLSSVNAESRSVSVLIGNGIGGFNSASEYPTGDLPLGGAVADLNRDHVLDLVVTNHQGNTVSVFHGRGDGTFAARVDHPAGGDHHNDPVGVLAVDVNRDGWDDLVIANSQSNTLAILLNRGNTAGASARAEERRAHEDLRQGRVQVRPVSGGGAELRYRVPGGGERVSIVIYSVAGGKVAEIVGGFVAEGLHLARWDGRGDGARRVTSGVYFALVMIGGVPSSHRIVLVE